MVISPLVPGNKEMYSGSAVHHLRSAPSICGVYRSTVSPSLATSRVTCTRAPGSTLRGSGCDENLNDMAPPGHVTHSHGCLLVEVGYEQACNSGAVRWAHSFNSWSRT